MMEAVEACGISLITLVTCLRINPVESRRNFITKKKRTVIVPVIISLIGVVELHQLFIEPLRVKYYSERLKVGEIDREHPILEEKRKK